jgi:ABC-type Zn2+ transport system substrate-binding protein/surface adhesin
MTKPLFKKVKEEKYFLMSVKFSDDKNLRSWKHYCWINPQGECFTSREIAPLGFLPCTTIDQFKGWKWNVLSCHGFKKENTKMSQDELSKGWLCR